LLREEYGGGDAVGLEAPEEEVGGVSAVKGVLA
jgi:hypothetical protein